MKKLLFITYAIAHLLIGASANAAPSEETTFFHTDALGSIIAASDEQGDVIWRKTYDPYGNEVISTENGEEYEGQAYIGKPYDRETGLVYLNQRYYDSELRRFMSIDPVGFRVDAPVSFNRYAYANNNPYKFVDPDGRMGIESAFTMGMEVQRRSAAGKSDSQIATEFAKEAALGLGAGATVVGMFYGGAYASSLAGGFATRFPATYSFLYGTAAGEVGLVGPSSAVVGGGGILFAKSGIPSVRNVLKQPFVQTQVRPNGSVNQLVNSRMLVVSENHLKDVSKVFKVHNGKLNAFNSNYWKHVLPHRHVYTSGTIPPLLNANWRKTFQKLGAEKTTIWPWQ